MAVQQAEEVSGLQVLVEYLALMLVGMQRVEEELRGLNLVAMQWVEVGWGQMASGACLF